MLREPPPTETVGDRDATKTSRGCSADNFYLHSPCEAPCCFREAAADKQLNSLVELVDPAEPTDHEVTVGGTCSVGTQTGRWNIYGYQLCLLTS